MKKLHLAGNLLKVMLLGGLLAGCQNQDTLMPAESATTPNDANAKTAALTKKLVEDGGAKLGYYTSGRDAGKLSYLIEPTGSHTVYYTYSDGTDGDYWISVKRKSNTTGSYTSQISYHVVNGRCVKSTDITNNKTYNYQYNESGRLDAILLEGSSEKREFLYYYEAAADAERLNKVRYSNSNGVWKEVWLMYTMGNGTGAGAPKLDKYLLNPEFTELDKYLPIFGKFSDVLVRQAGVFLYPDNGQAKWYCSYSYLYDAGGYATERYRYYYPFGKDNNTNMTSKTSYLKYGYPGQGI